MYAKKIKVSMAALFLACTAAAAYAETAPATQSQPAAPASTPSATGKTTDQIAPSNEVVPPATPPVAPAQPADGSSATPAAPATPEQATEPPADPEADGAAAEPGSEEGADAAPEELSIGEIPDIKVVDLTADTAKKSVDTYGLLKDKYKDARLEDYETLQEFVDKDPLGKAFETDVKAAGFADVELWNQTITTVSTTYSNMANDQTADTQAQIAEVEKDTELAKDMKDKLLASLRALIPTENNRKVVQSLLDDPAYSDKIKQLESEDE